VGPYWAARLSLSYFIVHEGSLSCKHLQLANKGPWPICDHLQPLTSHGIHCAAQEQINRETQIPQNTVSLSQDLEFLTKLPRSNDSLLVLQ